LIGADNDVELYRTLTQQGISDYLVAPLTPEQLRASIAKTYQGQSADAYDGRIIGILGAAGGVGSSVIAHNVTNELAELYGEKTAIIDLDICYGTAALNFNLQPRQTLTDTLGQLGRLDSDLLDQFFMPVGDRISLLASPSSLTTGMQVSPEAFDALMRAIKPMSEFTVLDIPHVWSPWVGDALAYVDDLVIIARPDLTNLRNTKNMIEYLGPKRGTDAPTRLILNQVGAAKRADLSAKDFREAVAIDPAASIPYDPEAFGRALNNGEMMAVAAEKSKATLAIRELARLVSDRVEQVDEAKRSIFSLFGKSKN
ncbi:pilus assembly protein CpaE, partial [bacterium]|nr:pilus assembly protein CpaE [bacterium]